MKTELTPPLAETTDIPAAGQPETTPPPPPAEERPRPEAAPLVTAGADERRTEDDYASIRAAALAMSGTVAPVPDPDDGHDAAPGSAGEDSRDAPPAPAEQPAGPAPAAREDAPAGSAGATDGPVVPAGLDAIHDESPDVLAAQAAEVGMAARESRSADEPASDGAGEAALPAPGTQAMPAAGGDHGGQPPLDPPAAEEEEPNPEEKPMSLLDHLNEMRWRLVRCFIAAAVGFCLCWAFVEPIFAVLVKPLLAVLPAGGNAMYSTMPEAFFIRMFVACIAGLFVASPVIFYQIWAFISPGLYEEEKLFIVPVAIISAVFFVGGALFCYHIVFPFAFQFFMSYSTEQIKVMPRISDYVDFVLKLLIAFGLIFEMPIFAFFLSRMGVLTAAMMRQARRYAILGIFIVAAILTPPDVLSQLLMAAPMLVLYEVSVIVAAVFGKKRRKAAEETEGTETAAETEDAAADPARETQDTGERA